MKYQCLAQDKRLRFSVDLTEMTEGDVMECAADLSFLKKLSIFLYEENQNKEIKHCSDTLLFDIHRYDLLSIMPFGRPSRGYFTHINEINDSIVELIIYLRDFNTNELCEKISNENKNLLKTNPQRTYASMYLNMDFIFSNPENLISFEKHEVLEDTYVFNYCGNYTAITKDAFEELLKYKKENNKKEYLLLKIIEETLK